MKRNVVEWLVLASSIAAIIILVVVLALVGLRENRPADPQIELHTDQARQGSLGWIVPATVANGGHEAAEAVVIEASAQVAGEPQMSSLEIDFLPAGTDVEVAFSFSAPPQGEISVRLVGFRVP